MRVLYVAPRYHTNQTAIMKGWIDSGNEVCFMTHYAGKLEDYGVLCPELIGYSYLFTGLNTLYLAIFGRKKEYASNMKLKFGFPPILKLYRHMKRFAPDVVITRERSIYTICVTLLCRWRRWPVILYNQSPAYEAVKKDIGHRIMYGLTPAYRITPVLKSARFQLQEEIPEKTYYLPFVMEPYVSPENKSYCKEGKIHLFSIGKYQKRKNHELIIRVAERLSRKYPIHLTIAGEVSDTIQEEYYLKLKKYIEVNLLADKIMLYRDLNRERIFELYKEADLFVLPSTDEPAAVSHLEAMAFSLPVISGEDNGTADYIINGENGFIFKNNDEQDLYEKIENIISDRKNILTMGRRSYELVVEKHQFAHYYEAICEIVEKIKKKE